MFHLDYRLEELHVDGGARKEHLLVSLVDVSLDVLGIGHIDGYDDYLSSLGQIKRRKFG